MTNLQYGTLRFLAEHEVTVEQLRAYNLTTMGSLIHRGYVARQGNRILLTESGVEAYRLFHQAGPNYRKHEGELSERVRLMLHLRALGVAS